MNKKLELILRGQIITMSIYTFIYLCRTFILFEFTNPFQWIVDIPTYTSERRGELLFYFIVYYCTLYIVIYQVYNDLSEKLKNKTNN